MSEPIVFVHGFSYDPRTPGLDHPEYHTYLRWREMLPEQEVLPFTWFSDPSVWNAWRHGRWNRYRRAWDMAEEASWRLESFVKSHRPVNIVCHSLGSRVVMRMLHRIGGVSKVLILNGAEYSWSGHNVAMSRSSVQFYNVVVPADDVLNVLARFAPGRDRKFLGNCGVASPPPNWQDLRLDDSGSLPRAWAAAHGLPAPAGDNPRSIGDHHYSYENEDNWPLYRAILSEEWDEWRSNIR